MDSVLRKLFSGDMDFRKTETNLFFAFCPRGGGVWGGIRAGFGFSFFGRATRKNTLIKIKTVIENIKARLGLLCLTIFIN